MSLINAISTLALIDFAKKHEFPLDAFLQKLNLNFEEIGKTKKISHEKAFQIWEEVRARFPDPLLHLKIHSSIPYGAYHALELACLSSRTIGDAVTVIVRYFNVINPEISFDLKEEFGKYIIELKLGESLAVVPPYYVEMVIGGILLRFKHPSFQQKTVSIIQYKHHPLGQLKEYEALFGTKVLFEQNRNCFVIDADTWSTEVLFSNIELFKSLEEHLIRERKALGEKGVEDNSSQNLIARIRRFVVLEISNKDLKINHAAQFLGMSVRSLQRYLQEENTSFSDILDQTRESLAKKYLSDESLTIAEIGFLLGFSEQSTFQRAFKRWTGQSPMAYRKTEKN